MPRLQSSPLSRPSPLTAAPAPFSTVQASSTLWRDAGGSTGPLPVVIDGDESTSHRIFAGASFQFLNVVFDTLVDRVFLKALNASRGAPAVLKWEGSTIDADIRPKFDSLSSRMFPVAQGAGTLSIESGASSGDFHVYEVWGGLEDAPEPTPDPTNAAVVWPHLDAAQTVEAQKLLDATLIPAADYVTHDAKWVELFTTLPDSPSRNSADQNSAQTELWKTLEADGTWLVFYGTQQKVDEIKQSWADYLSWLAGAPTYEYNGAVPEWGWSGYINGFQSWHGWILNFVPNKYGHLL